MRKRLIATGMLALTAGTAVAQQPPGAPYSVPGGDERIAPVTPSYSQRWGDKIGDRWWAGASAPGGWNGYRRPQRGWALPPYWNSPRFGVTDWQGYDLPPPPSGYRWTRYYDDAVLVDGRGSVRDSVDGVDWDRPGYGRDRPSLPSPRRWVSADGRMTVTTTSVGGTPGSYVYEDYPGGATRVTIESTPVVTTTTEYIQDRASRTRPTKRPARRAR